MDNAQKIWDKLIAAQGPSLDLQPNDWSGGLPTAQLTPAGAAGLLGNLYAESGLNPQNLQNSYEKRLGCTDADYTAAVDCGAYDRFVSDCAGYGLAQWTHPSRKAALLAHSKARGASIGDLNMQVSYLLQELQGLFPALWRLLRTTDNVREASDAVLLQFERPAGRSADNCARRAAIGQAYYDKFAGGTTMEYIMTSAELCARALDIAGNYKTSYMLGPWGWPATDKMITRATTQGSSAQTNRQWLAYANAIKGSGFIFDCVGLIKGILWGWNGDLSRTYGGAGYACNGVPDCDAKGMIDRCREVSTDFSAIVPGEAVWMDGHIGIYVGGGVVVESTPKWRGGVQRSTCLNVAGKQIPGTAGTRTWTKHGKLPWVDYARNEEKEEDDMKYYERLEDVPAWYRPAVEKLVKKGALNGTGDGGLNVSEEFCRVMTVMDRLGKLD